MLDCSAANLTRELRDAQAYRDKHLVSIMQVVRRMAGSYYQKAQSTDGIDSTPENYPFAYRAFVKPQICYQAPTITVEATRSIVDVPTADGLTLATNYWITETDFEDQLDRTVDDAIFGFGVMLTTVEAYGDHGGMGMAMVDGDTQLRPMWPACKRISPRNTLWDPLAESETEARFSGHSYERDLDDLIKQAAVDTTWDSQAVGQLESLPQDPDDDGKAAFPRGVGERAAKRPVIKLHQLYVPEWKKIYTLAEQTQGSEGLIVRTQDYFGPDQGPYSLFGVYSVPDQLIPLSVLVATFEQFLEVQTHAMKAADDAASFKQIAVGRADGGKDGEVVKDAKNGDMVLLKNGKDGVATVKMGGASPEQLNYLGVTRERYDRVMGFSDAQRGVPNDDTATANSIANSASDLRIAYMRKQITKCTRRVLEKVLWYMYNLDAVRMKIMGRDKQGQPMEGMFQGGQWEGGYINTPQGHVWQQPDNPEMDFTAFSLRINVDSMYKQDDPIVQKRAQDELSLGLQMMQMGLPVNIRFFLDQYGTAFNQVEFSKRALLDQGNMGMVPPDMVQASYPQQPQAQRAQMPAPTSSAPTGQPGLPAMPAGGFRFGGRPGAGVAPAGRGGLVGAAG
jgi:hypothetical protein